MLKDKRQAASPRGRTCFPSHTGPPVLIRKPRPVPCPILSLLVLCAWLLKEWLLDLKSFCCRSKKTQSPPLCRSDLYSTFLYVAPQTFTTQSFIFSRCITTTWQFEGHTPTGNRHLLLVLTSGMVSTRCVRPSGMLPSGARQQDLERDLLPS